jgi:hypothetical protein
MVLYKDEFLKAATNSRDLGLISYDVTVSQNKYLTNDILPRLPHVLRPYIGKLEPKDFSGKCVHIHYNLIPIVEDILQCKAYLTTGGITENGQRLFGITLEEVKEYLNKGLPNLTFNHHAWLTLDSMEIFDFTLMTTIGYVKKEPKYFGYMISKHPDDLIGMYYTPIIIGDAFYRKLNVLIDIVR